MVALLSLSLMVIECPVAEAAGVGTFMVQRPSLSAAVEYLSFVHDGETLTVDPGDALPQRQASVFCCRTILSEIRAGNCIFAAADRVERHSRIERIMREII